MVSITSTMSSQNATVTVLGASNVLVKELSIPSINTKVPFTLQSGLKTIIIRARGLADMKINFDDGLENFTIPRGSCFELNGLGFNGKILYIEASAIALAEIIQTY
jgi:hypothetical protein